MVSPPSFDRATGVPLFQRELQGKGQATIRLFPENPSFFEFQYDVSPIPEPATLLLIGSGLGMLGLRARRRWRSSSE